MEEREFEFGKDIVGKSRCDQLSNSRRNHDRRRNKKPFVTLEIEQYKTHGVLKTSNNEFVGCGLRPYDPENDVYELGFHLVRSAWGKGYASEAAEAMIEYAFNKIRAKKLFAGHHPENTASRKRLEKLGFVYIHDEFYPSTGLQHPSYELKQPPGQ